MGKAQTLLEDIGTVKYNIVLKKGDKVLHETSVTIHKDVLKLSEDEQIADMSGSLIDDGVPDNLAEAILSDLRGQ